MNLHERIATALGWTEAEVKTFSLPALRELVRPVSPKLAYLISDTIQNADHWFTPVKARKGQRTITYVESK